MIKKYNRKSVFVTLFLSFALILLFPLALESGLYYRMEAILKENANRSNVAMLNQISHVVDSRLEEVDQLAMQISFNPRLQWLLSRNDLMHRREAYEFVDFMYDLRNYRTFNGFIYDFYVYIPEQEIVVTPSAKSGSEMFYSHYYRYQNMSYEEWKKELLQKGDAKFYLPSKTIEQGMNARTENVVTYVHTLPFERTDPVKGVLVILINEQQIKNMLKNIERANHGDIYILDQDGQLIMTTADNAISLSEIDASLVQSNGKFERVVNEEEAMISYATSHRTGWKYISIVPTAVFMEKVNAVKTWAVILLALCLVIGLAAAYVLAYRHYLPVRDLVKSILKNQQPEIKVSANEYQLIKETLTHTWDTEKQLREVITQHTPTIRSNFLLRLIKGFVDQSAVTPQSLDFMGLDFISDRFVVIIADVDDCSQFAPAESERQWAIVRFIIENVSKELANAHHHGHVVELDRNRLALLINVEEERVDWVAADIDRTVHTLKKVVEERFKIYMSIGIGGVYQGIDRIGKSYGEAMQALEYRMVKGKGKITYFHEIHDGGQNYYYPIDVELRLMNAIKTGDFASADKILDNVYRINFQSRQLSLELGKCLFFNIMSTLVKILNEIKVEYESVFPNDTDPIKQLAECRTVSEMHKNIKEIYQRLCLYIEKTRGDHSEQLLANIMHYIEEHYADNGLSLTSLSAAFNLTPQYLSSFFKKYKGENLTQFIAAVRIRHAKTMLQDKTLTIAQVAQKIGYANDVGLIRLFKKYEGITPGKYREKQDLKARSS